MLTIKLLRTVRGISGRELARRLGVSAAQWHRIEHGDAPLAPELLPGLAGALTLSVEDIARAVGATLAPKVEAAVPPASEEARR
jgi:transcriptional regulator with XRE-family HTH domain